MADDVSRREFEGLRNRMDGQYAGIQNQLGGLKSEMSHLSQLLQAYTERPQVVAPRWMLILSASMVGLTFIMGISVVVLAMALAGVSST